MTESQFRNVKNFLRAYVTEYEKAHTDLNDISWTARAMTRSQSRRRACSTRTARMTACAT
ncbi:MAG: hypothetical protein ACLS34_06245 [Faecalibacterium sp.]